MTGARLTEAQRGVLLSSMSDSSCGLTLGRSTDWVVRMRRALEELVPAPSAAPVPEPATPTAERLPAEEASPQPRPASVPSAAPVRREASAQRARVSRSAPVIRLKPVSVDIARWARGFLASPLWTADEVADLFGVHPDALIDAVAG